MSNTDSYLEDYLQWRDPAAPCMHDEMRSMLGDAWIDLGTADLATPPPPIDPVPAQKIALTCDNPETALPLEDHDLISSLLDTHRSDNNDFRSSAGHQWAPNTLTPPNDQLELASIRTAQALDDYLESYSSLESSIEELLGSLDGGNQSPSSNSAVLDDIHQGIANARGILITRSNAVKEARSKWMALRSVIQQEQYTGDCSDVEPSLDDDNMSEISTTLEVPAVVEEYFRVAGEAFIEHERLTDLEYEYKERAAAQKCDCYRGQDSTVPITNCEVTYQQKRQQLGVALSIRQSQLHAQRGACLAQGLDPEYYRYRGVMTRRPRP